MINVTITLTSQDTTTPQTFPSRVNRGPETQPASNRLPTGRTRERQPHPKEEGEDGSTTQKEIEKRNTTKRRRRQSTTQRRCGLPFDSLGHHRAACARAGVLGKRGWAPKSVAARICREGGVVVSQPTCWCVIWIWPSQEQLPLTEGSRSLWMASRCSEGLVCALRSDGRPTKRAAVEDGAKVTRARRRSETTYPELVG